MPNAAQLTTSRVEILTEVRETGSSPSLHLLSLPTWRAWGRCWWGKGKLHARQGCQRDEGCLTKPSARQACRAPSSATRKRVSPPRRV